MSLISTGSILLDSTFKQKNKAAELGWNLLTHKNLCENKLYARELLYIYT